MMRIMLAILTLTTSLMIDLPRAGADVDDDQKKPAGTWKVTSATVAGAAMPTKERDNIRVIFEGNNFSIVGTPDGDKRTTFKLDPAKSPATIDIAPPPGEMKVALGIYEFDGKTLKLCFSVEGNARPTDFKDSKGKILLILEKTK